MSADRLRHHHELDARLAHATLFGWLRPAFRLAVKHWPFSLGAGFASVGVASFTAVLPGLPVGGLEGLFANFAIRLFYEMLALSLVTVVAYRLLAENERVGAINDWRQTLIRTVQITGIWWIAACIVGGVVFLLSWAGFVTSVSAVSRMNDVGDLVGTMARNRIWGLVTGVVVFLLSPVATAIGVAGVLSTVHAVRSRETALDAVRKSLQLAFEQMWRVVWPTYVLIVLWILLSLLVLLVALLDFTQGFRLRLFFGFMSSVCSIAYGVGMTFVIERAYAPDLTLPEGEEATSPPPSASLQPGGAATHSIAEGRAPLPPTEPTPTRLQEGAARLAEDLRTNRIHRLVENVERELAADPKFFTSQPDSTLALGKRLVALSRPDLALRVIQPYLKDHREHRQHFTTALFVADVLARDPRRLAVAARFLAQLKTLYPREPMVDQLIKTTDRAIAVAGNGADKRGPL